jgi:hypothetical protein
MTNARTWSVGLVIAVFSVLSSSEARADPKQECAAAYDQTQALRDAGKLTEARKKALACSAPSCATFIVKECAQWLTEIDAGLPTVVLVVADAAGADTLAVRVSIDGQSLGEKLDGKAVPIDPGEHLLRFEMPGADAIEQKLVIRQGEKNRRVAVSFAKAPLAPVQGPPAPGPAKLPGDPPPPEAPSKSGLRIGGFVVGGVGIVGLTTGIVAGVMAIQSKNSANCVAGLCDAGPLASARHAALAADVSLSAGGVLLATGVTMVAIGSVSVTPAVGPSSGALVVRGRL